MSFYLKCNLVKVLSKVGNNNTFQRIYSPLPSLPVSVYSPGQAPGGASLLPGARADTVLSHNIWWVIIRPFHSIFISSMEGRGRDGDTGDTFLKLVPHNNNIYLHCPYINIMEKLFWLETIAVMFIPRYLNWSGKSLFISYTKYTMTITLWQQET